MATNWKGGNGQWQVAANWSNGAPTTPQSFAVIDAAGTYTVSIGSGLEYNVGAVRLAGANATLSIAGILDLTNKLTVSNGTLAVSGTVNGGSIVAAGGKIAFQNGTLDGVKYLGTLDLSTAANTVTIKDGLTLRGVNGTGTGAMTLGGSSQLNFAGTQTLNGGTWTISGGTVAQTGTLTLGTSEDVEYKAAKNIFTTSSSLVNKGKFNIGKSASLATGQFVNSGKMTVNGGGGFDAATFTNTAAGSVAVYSGSIFQSENFANAGTLSADSAKVYLTETSGGSFGTLNITNSNVQLRGIASVGELNTLESMLAGHANSFTAGLSLDNTGNTITLGTPSGFKAFIYAGSIQGGTVTIGATLDMGSLSGLTLHGSLTAINGLSLNTVTVADANASLTVTGGVTLDDVTFANSATIHLAGALNIQNVTGTVDVIAAAGSALITTGPTIESGLTIRAQGAFTAGYPGARVVNKGTLEEDGAGAQFKYVAFSFDNIGTLSAQNGGDFLLHVRENLANFTGKNTGGTLTGGTYDVGANSTLTMILNRTTAAITTLQANVVLDGAGANFVNLAGLTTVGTQGDLSLQDGATLTVNSSFTDDGTLHLAGSNFTATKITVDAGGTLNGHGAVLGAVANAGTIDASGGTLSISQGVTGTGAVNIENNATLSFGAAVAAGQTVTFEGTAGTLGLGNAGGFAGTITGFAPGNAIDLINTKASAVTYDAGADTLTVKNKGTVIATLQLSGDYTGDTFGLASDGKGGTEITVTAAAPAVHRFNEAVAAFSPSHMASIGLSAAHDSNQLTPAVAANHVHFG